MGRAFSQMRQLANQCSSRLLETKEIHSVSLSPTQKEDMKFFKGRWVRGGGHPFTGTHKELQFGCVGVCGRERGGATHTIEGPLAQQGGGTTRLVALVTVDGGGCAARGLELQRSLDR